MEQRRDRGENTIPAVLERQREYFQSGKTLDVSFRMEQLEVLKSALKVYEGRFLEALEADMGKSPFEAYETEIGVLYEEIRFAQRRLKRWAKPELTGTPLTNFPAVSRIYKEPLGVVLILSPWNYPLQLAIAPLISAMAAGNCAMLKPSRNTPRTSVLIGEMLRHHFPAKYISVFWGGDDVNEELLRQKFEHIFFTGSKLVGKVVMEAASINLTPVTLELGGKSPCIVDETAKLELAARRIAWGKCLNAGQTCVAPDYLLVHASVKDVMVERIEKYIAAFYGREPLSNRDYPRIINDRHFNRLCELLNDGRVIHGAGYDSRSRKIEPALIDMVDLSSPIMQSEIFGPLLPVITFEKLDEAIHIVQSMEKPLALYLFTTDRGVEKRILTEVSFGGGCINDTIMHLANPMLGFGGVGGSGMGAYHGKTGFETFTHRKSVLKKSNLIDVPFRYPPYGNKLKWLKKIMK